MTIKPGDVVALRGKVYKEDPRASGHPAVVLHSNNTQVIMAICTSYTHHNKFSAYEEIDYQRSGLSKRTIVICDKTHIASIGDISSVIGSLSRSDRRRVFNRIASDAVAGKVKIYEQVVGRWRNEELVEETLLSS